MDIELYLILSTTYGYILDPTLEALGVLREAYDTHHKAEKDRGLLADRVSEACTALLRLQEGRSVSHEDGTVVAWNVIHELKSVVDQYEDAVQFALKERQRTKYCTSW